MIITYKNILKHIKSNMQVEKKQSYTHISNVSHLPHKQYKKCHLSRFK